MLPAVAFVAPWQPSAEPVSELDRLLGMLPAAVYRKDAGLLVSVLAAIAAELERARGTLAEEGLQGFPATATWALDRWERQLGLPLGVGLTTRQRQARAVTRYRGLTQPIGRYMQERVKDALHSAALPTIVPVTGHPRIFSRSRLNARRRLFLDGLTRAQLDGLAKASPGAGSVGAVFVPVEEGWPGDDAFREAERRAMAAGPAARHWKVAPHDVAVGLPRGNLDLMARVALNAASRWQVNGPRGHPRHMGVARSLLDGVSRGALDRIRRLPLNGPRRRLVLDLTPRGVLNTRSRVVLNGG